MANLEKTSAVSSRKQTESQLEKAKRDYLRAKAQYESGMAELSRLQAQVDASKAQMLTARTSIIDLGGHIQTMDLSGASAIRDRGDVKTYLVDDKEYVVDKSDVNDIKMTPWREYKSTLADKGTQQLENMVDEGRISQADDMDIGNVYAAVFREFKQITG
jgi:hypothetical protein